MRVPSTSHQGLLFVTQYSQRHVPVDPTQPTAAAAKATQIVLSGMCHINSLLHSKSTQTNHNFTETGESHC